MVCLVAAAISGACVPELEIEAAYYIPPDSNEQCPPNGCGGNSPVVGGVYFWRLNLWGQPSPEGVQITGVHKGGTQMALRLIERDRLKGVDPMTGALIAEGSTLIGTKIDLLVKNEPYQVEITWAAPSANYWVGAQLPVWQYRFEYRPMFGGDRQLQPLCSEADDDPTMLDALVFGGDLYDPETKEITVGPTTLGWMNIACAHSALWKQQLVGYTTAAQHRLGIVTTVAQRRAMLNAWTSNVCGTGEAFTHQGEPITLHESLGVFNMAPYNAATQLPEAIWDQYGAKCLDYHRLEEDDEDIYTKIEAACGGQLPPSCSTLSGPWQLHGDVITGSP